MSDLKVPVFDQSHLGAKGFFFVGESCKGTPDARFMDGQMFVEVYVPKNNLEVADCIDRWLRNHNL